MGKKILMKDNEALAEATVRVGCRLYCGYPITPQTEIMEYLSDRMPQVGGSYIIVDVCRYGSGLGLISRNREIIFRLPRAEVMGIISFLYLHLTRFRRVLT